MKISLITTCKGRLEHLKQTLPGMLAQGNNTEVIVVDYDCPDGTAAWIEEHCPQVRVVRVDDEPVFSPAKARNLGAAEARGDWLLFVDADIMMPADFVSRMAQVLSAGNFYHAHRSHSEVFGTFFCARDDFLALGGYDEVLRPWGGEDRDIYYRLRHFLHRANPGYPGELLVPLTHPDADRLRFCEATDKQVSQRANVLYLKVKYDLWRLAGKLQLPADVRQPIYETIRKQVLENAARGLPLTRVEIDATRLPSISMPHGWLATRKLKYELFPQANTVQKFIAETGMAEPSRALERGTAVAGFSPAKLSLITTCKGRLEHLKQTLPGMVAQGENTEVIVVDYDCPDGTAAWVAEHYPQVPVVRVHDAPIFNISKARNRGAVEASGDWLMFIDADILIPPDFASRVYPMLRAGNFYHPHHRHFNAYGTSICARTDFLALGGYDEALRPWGGEDVDFYYRLQHFLNRTNPGFPGELLTPILHSDAERMRFCEAADKAASMRANGLYRMVKYDLFRLAGSHQLPMELRQQIYETIRKQVLTGEAEGLALTRVEIEASQLPSIVISQGWHATRKLQYDLFPQCAD